MASKKILTVEELLEKMKNNGDCTRDFEVALTDFVNAQDNADVLVALLNDGDKNRSFLGFYGMFIYFRRLMQYDELEKMLNQYGDAFTEYTSLGHLRTQYHIDSGENYMPSEIEKHIGEACDVANRYWNMSRERQNINVAGTQHAFADLLITYCERYEAQCEQLMQKWGKKTEFALEQSMQLSPEYAKYYCTYGRLLALKNDYKGAMDSIQKAIRMETPNGNASRYSLRIMQYQSHLVRIQARGEIHKLNIRQAQITEDVEKMRNSLMSNVEIIGFFSGIISFIIGSLTLANGSTAGDAAGLIIILLGALLIVFNCFALLLHMDKKSLPARIAVFVVGILCIVGGLILVL